MQTDHSFGPAFYEAQMYFLQKEIDALKEENARLMKQPFGYFLMNDDSCLYYTSLHLSIFNVLNQICEKIKFKYYTGKKVTVLSFTDQLLLTLMKLRHNYGYMDLGWRFGISHTTVYNIVNTFLHILHTTLFKTIMEKIPTQKKNTLSLPACFSSFQNCRIILDCTEVSCAIPDNLTLQKVTYSSYKHKHTLKVLIGVAPNGVLTYCSDVYPGSLSDKAIVKDSGILNQFQAGDLILADKGFLISDILPPGVSLNVPPFLSLPQFTPAQVEETRRIARARIHVERVIKRLKIFQILEHIPKEYFSKATIIVQVCAVLVNFQTPILKEVEPHLTCTNTITTENC